MELNIYIFRNLTIFIFLQRGISEKALGSWDSEKFGWGRTMIWRYLAIIIEIL